LLQYKSNGQRGCGSAIRSLSGAKELDSQKAVKGWRAPAKEAFDVVIAPYHALE
jgi:hypothetical protein